MTDGDAIYGRVRNGAIELDAPLDLPDGTNVIIDVIEPHEVPGAPRPPFDPIAARRMVYESLGLPVPDEDPGGVSKSEGPRG